MCIPGVLTTTKRTPRQLISPLGPNWVCPHGQGHPHQVLVGPLLGLFAWVLYIKIIVKIIRDCEVDLVDNPVSRTLGHSASDTKKLPGCILGEETFLSSVRTPEPSMGPGIFRIG